MDRRTARVLAIAVGLALVGCAGGSQRSRTRDNDTTEKPDRTMPELAAGAGAAGSSRDGGARDSSVATPVDGGTTPTDGPPVYGTVPTGGYCTETSDCQRAHHCYENTCRSVCTQDVHCGSGTGRCCNFYLSDVNESICNLATACDPFGPSAINDCPTGQGCYMIPCPANRSNYDCIPAGNVPRGQPCTYTNDCSPGNLCINQNGNLLCARVCRLDADDCGDGPDCTQLSNGGPTYGYCPP